MVKEYLSLVSAKLELLNLTFMCFFSFLMPKARSIALKEMRLGTKGCKNGRNVEKGNKQQDV